MFFKNKIWLKAAIVRAARTMAQSAMAIIGTETFMGEIRWMAVLSAVCLSGILSILTSISGLPEVSEKTEKQEK